MKRNFAYMIHMYRHDSFAKFKVAAKAVLEHHFNNHVFCGEWCPAEKWKDDEVQRKALKYRCKVSNAELYQQMSTIHNAYTDVWNLREIYHEVHSNKCESLNGFITKFLPKHKHYCRTIVNRARTYLAIGLDSLGYENYYSVLFSSLGIINTTLTTEHFQRLDRRRIWKAKYDKSDKAKKARKQKLNEKLRMASELLMKDQKIGNTYGSNIAGPQVEGMTLNVKEEMQSRSKKGQHRKKPTCNACHTVGHATNKSKDCVLTIKKMGKHYKPENEYANRKFDFCSLSVYVTIISAPDR
jgi:hypothetical protein